MMGNVMEEKKPGYLQEDNGNKSLTRIMSVTCLVAAYAVMFIAMIKGDPGGQGFQFFLVLMLAAFCPKILQKFAEQKVPQ
jgi:hypothetical protein